MQFEEVVEVESSHMSSCVGMTEGQEMTILGQSVNHHKYNRLAPEHGSPLMKSILTSLKAYSGICRGCKRLGEATFSDLYWRQVVQLQINFAGACVGLS